MYLFSEQVGTLDVLVGLSDELAKLDSFVERYNSALSLYLNLHILSHVITYHFAICYPKSIIIKIKNLLLCVQYLYCLDVAALAMANPRSLTLRNFTGG